MGQRQRANHKARIAAKRARKLADAAFTPKVLKTKESRRKLHRWTFAAYFTRMVPVAPDQEIISENKDPETGGPEQVVAQVESPKVEREFRYTLPNVLVGNQEDADKSVADLEKELANPDVKNMRVTAIPHETVSPAIFRQLKGYQDFNDILQTAFEQAVEDLIAGQPPLSLDLAAAKQKYYEQAVAKLKPKPEAEPQIIAPEENSDPVDLEKLQALAMSPGQE